MSCMLVALSGQTCMTLGYHEQIVSFSLCVIQASCARQCKILITYAQTIGLQPFALCMSRSLHVHSRHCAWQCRALCWPTTASLSMHGNAEACSCHLQPVFHLHGNAGSSAGQLQPVLHRAAEASFFPICLLHHGHQKAAVL